METLRYVVLVNSLLAVVSVAYYVLLRRETYFNANRLVLWLGLLAAFTLPLLELPDWRPQPVRTVMQRTAQVIVPRVLPKPYTPPTDITITFPNQKTYRAFQVHQERFVWSWQAVLVAFYAFIVFALLIRFSLQLLSLRKIIRQSVHEAYNNFTLVRNERVTSPFSFLSWVVLNPTQHTPNELEQILRHERVHVRERHSIDMIGTELVGIFFWFNPAAYLFRYLLHQTLEFRADRVVLAEGVDAKAYQYNLLKVNILASQSTIRNYFSESHLKSRIAMLNQPESTRIIWFKYPVFLIVILLVTAAFARPGRIKALGQYVPKAVAGRASIGISSSGQSTESVSRPTQPVYSKPIKATLTRNSTLEAAIQPAALSKKRLRTDSVRISPSRYMAYQGDYLYWTVTPKTTINDFAVMKQEFAKHGYQLQLNELKYDPLDTFICGIMYRTGFKAKVSTPTSTIIFQGETSDDPKPISTIAGYIGIKNNRIGEARSSRLDGRYSKTTLLYQTVAEEEFPDVLRQVAAGDEAFVTQFITDRKMDYLVLAGERKNGHLGIGFRKFDQKEIKKQAKHGGFVDINPDGSLSINEGPSPWIIKAFINNESATLEEVQKLKINQLYTLAVILGYNDTAQKRSGTDYLFFYVNETK